MAKFSDNDPLNSSNVSQDIPLRETAPGLEGDLVGQGTAETGVTMEIDTPPPLSDPLPAPVPTPTPDPDPRPEDLIPEPTPDLMPVPSPVPTPERPVIPPLPKPRKIIPELKEDYIKAYKSYFMHTGDHQVAKELGLLELRRSWAETSADGSGRLTKHAPELEYPSLSADAIKQRFETDLAAQGFDPETTFL
ncbi:MAG: hypothetical protein HOB79_14930, partial [Rhodospirillaceae bacterium]|nr:hypothetical protein [Rhodospirillaceae bacterium]